MLDLQILFVFFLSHFDQKENNGSLKIPRGEKYDVILKEFFVIISKWQTFLILLWKYPPLDSISGLDEWRSQVFLYV